MGFSNGSIGKASSEKRAIGSDRLETIVFKYPKLNLVWLVTGGGEMINVSQRTRDLVIRVSDIVNH